MARKIGNSTYEVAAGVVVLPIYGANEKRDGWQVVVDGEYAQDFQTKREAVAYAQTLVEETAQ